MSVYRMVDISIFGSISKGACSTVEWFVFYFLRYLVQTSSEIRFCFPFELLHNSNGYPALMSLGLRHSYCWTDNRNLSWPHV